MAIINGDSSSQTLTGTSNDDTFTGNGGNDVFDFIARGFGDDVITDFNAGDRIDLSALNVADFETLRPFMRQVIDDVVIQLGYGFNAESITIKNANLDLLSGSSFIFNTSAAPVTATGVSSNDVLFGGNANDTIIGNGGHDALNGGAGNDTMTGGTGNDIHRGGAGNDVFAYSERQFDADTIMDFTAGDRIDVRGLNVGDFATLAPYMRQVIDDVVIDLGYGFSNESITIKNVDLASLTASSFIFNTSTTPVNVAGVSSNDVLFGGNANDTVIGNGGHDELNGGAGNDTLTGGTGNDIHRGGAGNDVFAYSERQFDADTILDFAAGDRIDVRGLNVGDLATLRPFMRQEGDDVVIELGYGFSNESITIKNVTLASLTSASFIFNTGASALNVAGVSSNDVLFGGNANDTVNGGGGHDALNGGAGNDTLTGGTGNDIHRGGAGNDVFAYAQRQFDADTIMDFTAGDRIDLRGLNVADLDTLAPFMRQDGADVVIDLGYGFSNESITIKNVTLGSLNAGSFIFNAAPAALTVAGLSSNDVLFGGNANDTVNGGGGHDFINGGAGDDLLQGGTGNDWARGGAGNDRLLGGDGADTLEGGAGTDTLMGGVGNDVYINPVSTEVVELAGQGFDRVISETSFSLATLSYVERLELTGNIPGFLRGNNFDNQLVGNAGSNTMSGFDGNDVIFGGGGRDTIIGGMGRDQIAPGLERDTIKWDAVAESTGATRDFVSEFVFSNGSAAYESLDFHIVPTAVRATITTGSLSEASFDANLQAAVNASNLGAGQAVLFDPNGGNLNIAGHVYLIVDANGVAGYQAGQDYVVQFTSTYGTLTLANFI